MDEYRKYEPFFGSWYLSKLIGRGSFGKVFEIVREEYGITYKSALKIISIPQDEDDIKARIAAGEDMGSVTAYYESVLKEIITENMIMARLKGNSHIVSYEDHQIIPHENGVGYDMLIRMELLTPLLDRMIEKKLNEKDVVRLGIDICKALDLCHRKNIIHRDIKPQNIFVSESGDYKLGDFGIARTMERTTGYMSRKGTFKYMAPEVFRGEQYDSTADLYSLGIVLFTLLNGNRGPFLPAPPAIVTAAEEEEARMRRIRGEAIPSPREAGVMLSYIIKKACEADPAKRYRTAGHMRRDLESYLANYDEQSVAMPAEYDFESTEDSNINDPFTDAKSTSDVKPGNDNDDQTVIDNDGYDNDDLTVVEKEDDSDQTVFSNDDPTAWDDVRDADNDQNAVNSSDIVPGSSPGGTPGGSPSGGNGSKNIKKPLLIAAAAILAVGLLVFFTYHVYDPPTCTDPSVCKICGKVMHKATGHDWDSGVVTTNPSCEKDGVKTYTCKNDPKHTKEEAIPATGHDWIAATYDTPETCRNCGTTRGSVKGMIYSLEGEWSDEKVSFGSVQTHVWEFSEIENCRSMKFTFGLDEDFLDHDWNIVFRSNGSWSEWFIITRERIVEKASDPVDGLADYPSSVVFDIPTDIDAVVVYPIDTRENDSWNISVMFKEGQAGE